MHSKQLQEKTQFYLRSPNQKTDQRKSFAIIKRLRGSRNDTFKNEQTSLINEQYQAGTLTFSEAKAAFNEIIRKLRITEDEKFNKLSYRVSNLKIVERYWNKTYKHKQNVDLVSAKNRLIRAIKVLGELSLLSATQDEIQTAINSVAKKLQKQKRGTGKNQREVVAALKQLLNFVNRTDVHLVQWNKKQHDVKYLTLEEFEEVIKHVTDGNFKTLLWVAISTGCRIGEIFALKEFNPKQKTIFVKGQKYKDGTDGNTKNRKPRLVRVLDEGIPHLQNWLKLSSEVKFNLRKIRHAELLTAACKLTFPTEENKHLVFHDLRHSYAIHLLNNNVSLTLVAKSLGNSIQVCQEHYVGFTLQDENIASISHALENK